METETAATAPERPRLRQEGHGGRTHRRWNYQRSAQSPAGGAETALGFFGYHQVTRSILLTSVLSVKLLAVAIAFHTYSWEKWLLSHAVKCLELVQWHSIKLWAKWKHVFKIVNILMPVKMVLPYCIINIKENKFEKKKYWLESLLKRITVLLSFCN